MRFPIKVDIALAAHKVSLLIQSELAGIDTVSMDQFAKYKMAFSQDRTSVFQHINRLIRCTIDCLIFREDGIGIRHALELARSFAAKVWDKSPMQMRQIETIGPAATRKLAAAGLRSIEILEEQEPHRLEMILSKNPPFGSKLLAKIADFPKLFVSLKMTGKETRPGQPVKIKIKAEIGFINEKPPLYFQRRPIHVIFMAERSDGLMVDFRRIA